MQQILNKLDTSSWENYKRSLGEAMEFANDMGITDNQISEFAQQFGSYLAQNITPDIPENRALKELWEIASPEEQRTIAGLMMKLAKNSK
ncbi:MAG: DUF3243 domain-containing protein [Bacillota bacterium]|jgi:hypothetical protein|nr:DUF3243 domain-containing protein [Clostridia bacterium]